LAVADEIRLGRCNAQMLTLVMHGRTISEATKAKQALASAIQLDRNMEYLALKMENGFTDEAGVALAEALAVNKTLRKIRLCISVLSHRRVTLGAPAYLAFGAMLRVNTNLVLELPSFLPSTLLLVMKGLSIPATRCVLSRD
jgi:hypothetical protein